MAKAHFTGGSLPRSSVLVCAHRRLRETLRSRLYRREVAVTAAFDFHASDKNPLIRRLSVSTLLSGDEAQAISALPVTVRSYKTGQDLCREADAILPAARRLCLPLQGRRRGPAADLLVPHPGRRAGPPQPLHGLHGPRPHYPRSEHGGVHPPCEPAPPDAGPSAHHRGAVARDADRR